MSTFCWNELFFTKANWIYAIWINVSPVFFASPLIMYLYFKSRYKNVSELHFLHKNAVKYYSIKLFPHPKTSDGSATLSQNSGAKNHHKIMCFWIFAIFFWIYFRGLKKSWKTMAQKIVVVQLAINHISLAQSISKTHLVLGII